MICSETEAICGRVNIQTQALCLPRPERIGYSKHSNTRIKAFTQQIFMYVPDAILSTGNTDMNNKVKFLCPCPVFILVGRDRTNINKKQKHSNK